MKRFNNVHKFGQECLASAEDYRRVSHIINEKTSPQSIIIISAHRSMRTLLVRYAAVSQSNEGEAALILQQFFDGHEALILNLLSEDSHSKLLHQLREELSKVADYRFKFKKDVQLQKLRKLADRWAAMILYHMVSYKIGCQFVDDTQFENNQKISRVFDLLLNVSTEFKKPTYEPVIIYPFECDVTEAVESLSDTAQNPALAIEQQVIGNNDFSVELATQGDVHLIYFWNKNSGIYSGDPQTIKSVRLLPLLRADEAAEFSLSHHLLNKSSVSRIKNHRIMIKFRTMMAPNKSGTRIENIVTSGRGAKFISKQSPIYRTRLRFNNDCELLQVNDLQLYLNELGKYISPIHAWQLQGDAIELVTEQPIAPEQIASLCTKENASSPEHGLFKQVGPSHKGQMMSVIGSGVTCNCVHYFTVDQMAKKYPNGFMFACEDKAALTLVYSGCADPSLEQTLHHQLFGSKKKIALILCGLGNIATSWFDLFFQQKENLEKRHNVDCQLVGVVNSSKYYFNEAGIENKRLFADFDDNGVFYRDFEWMKHLQKLNEFDEMVVLDLTASPALASQYISLAEQGIHVISANKIAGSGPIETYLQNKKRFSELHRYWLYNATVGAGLPINHALKDLQESGDSIKSITGIFSGTLSWLFQQYDGSIAFSELLQQAWQQGLTEPDPRNDLDGTDVMRKLIIAVREAGHHMEPEQVKTESLVPWDLKNVSVDDFLDNCYVLDRLILDKFNDAQKKKKVLRYVARFKANGESSVGLEALDRDHPLSNLNPCDNIFAIKSKWYKDNPLIIQGPGGGRQIAAGAVQSDLNKLVGFIA